MNVAAGSVRRILKGAAAVKGTEWTNGMIATVHPCGNGLNYNPHVHLISTRELVNIDTGELISPRFVPYAAARIKWMKTSLRFLVKKGCLTHDETNSFIARFPRGFHVHFKPIQGNENDVLFKTAEYLGAGIFHNSQIEEVNHEEVTVTFKFRRWIDRHTKEKLYAVQTLNIYEFMARMLYYLPDRHCKSVRYYGFYARGIDEKLDMIRKKTWAYAIEHCFQKDPELCPRCRIPMTDRVVFSFEAERTVKKLTITHYLYQGYFLPRRGP